MKKYIILFVLIFATAGVVYANTFPTTLNNWGSGQTISSAWANALEAKIGADSSAVISSLDYKLTNLFSTKTTSNLTEGTNLYYTSDRASSTAISAIVASSSIMKTYATQTVTGSTTFTKQVIVPNVLSSDSDKAANVAFVLAQTSAGVASSTNSVYGKSRLSVAAVDVNYPIVVGDNDTRLARAVIASSSLGTNLISTSTINVVSTSTIFDVYFRVASTTPYNGLWLYFNGNTIGNLYSSSFLQDGTSKVTTLAATSSKIAICGANSTVTISAYFHLTIDNSTNQYRNGVYEGSCSDSADTAAMLLVSGSFRWATTTPITSISITGQGANPGNVDTTNSRMATTSWVVYQK